MTLHLNVENLTAHKICVIGQLATRHKAFVILLQETHCTNADQPLIPYFTLASWVSSRNHVLATFIHDKHNWSLVDQSSEKSAIEWLCMNIDGRKIVNVLQTINLAIHISSNFRFSCLYAADFNCQHTEWGYNYTSPNIECLADWAAKRNLSLLYNPKDAPSFFSGRWNNGTNPDLAFVSEDLNSFKLERHTSDKFPGP